jgi:hypothetical protein
MNQQHFDLWFQHSLCHRVVTLLVLSNFAFAFKTKGVECHCDDTRETSGLSRLFPVFFLWLFAHRAPPLDRILRRVFFFA